jgi:hypothetical protein
MRWARAAVADASSAAPSGAVRTGPACFAHAA